MSWFYTISVQLSRHTSLEQWVTNVFFSRLPKKDQLQRNYTNIYCCKGMQGTYCWWELETMSILCYVKNKLNSVQVEVARSKFTSCEGSWKPLAATNVHSPSLSSTSRRQFDSISRSVSSPSLWYSRGHCKTIGVLYSNSKSTVMEDGNRSHPI